MQFGKMDTSSVLTITEMLLKTSSLYYYLSQYGSGNNRINFGINQVIDILRQLDNLHDSILIIENLICDYFYHGATVELVRLILAKAIENNVQLFITTNNLVFIEEFIQYLVKTDNQDLGTFVRVGNSAMKSSRGQPIATEVSIDYMLRSGWDFRTLI
jgi:AAA15 family ATPase/GTPase